MMFYWYWVASTSNLLYMNVHHYLCSINSTVFVIYLITDFMMHHVYPPSSTHLGNGSSIIIYTIMAYNFLIIFQTSIKNAHIKACIKVCECICINVHVYEWKVAWNQLDGPNKKSCHSILASFNPFSNSTLSLLLLHNHKSLFHNTFTSQCVIILSVIGTAKHNNEHFYTWGQSQKSRWWLTLLGVIKYCLF